MKNKKKNILILGANGLIGRFFFENLNKNYNVNGLSHKKTNNKKIFKTNYKNFSKKILTIINQADFIINCIGESNNENRMKEININVLKNITSQIRNKKKYRTFVHLSTCGVYGASNQKREINEKTKSIYTSLYSKTKIEGERILSKNLKGVATLIILRPSQIIGLNMKNTSIKKLYFFIKKKLFFFVNNKNSFYSYIFADDLLNVINKLITKKTYNNIYNISNKIKYYNLVKIIQKNLNQNFSFPNINHNLIKFLIYIFKNFLFIELPITKKNLRSMTTINQFNSKKILNHLKIKSLININSKNINYLTDE